MKKLSVVLISLLCLTLLVTTVSIGVFAEGTATDPAANLVVHYDFEGATPEEQLADKAGTSKENLTLFTTGEAGAELSKIENGVAKINSAGNNYLLCDFATAGEGVGADLQGLTNMTVFVQFSAEGTGTQWCDAVHIDNLARLFTCNQKDAQSTYDLRARIGESCHSSNRLDAGAYGQSFFETDDVVIVALSASFDATAKTVKLDSYLSFDNGATFEHKTKEWTEIDSFYSACNYISLGKLFSAKDGDRGFSFNFHDVRIYNAALTEDQVKSVYSAPTGGGDTTVTTTPEENTTTPEEVTTAPEKVTNAPEKVTNAPETNAATTEAPANTKSGCGAVTGICSVFAISAVAVVACKFTRKKED